MRCHLVYVTANGYKCHSAIEAGSLQEACAAHIDAWHAKQISTVLVLRLPSGKRNSYVDSRSAIKNTEAA